MRTLLLPLLTGCQFLSEQRVAPDVVLWSGNVYADTPSDTAPLLTGGAFDVVDLDGEAVAAGNEPQADSPGYWQVEVPVGIEVAIRLSGPESTPTVLRATTPSGRAFWLGGALFARSTTTTTSFFSSLQGYHGLFPGDLGDGDIAHLWGEPADPSAFAGAEWQVIDGADVEHEVLRFVADDEGLLTDAGTGPVDVFVATDLAPGEVTLTVATSDGHRTVVSYPALGGDLLSPIFLAPGAAP